jgi:hypothetical protein
MCAVMRMPRPMRLLRSSRARSLLVVAATILAGAAAMASCALEGDVFTLLPDGGSSTDSGVPFDSGSTPRDSTLDTFDADPFETDLDGAWIHCQVDSACHLTTERCCIWAALDPYCTEIGNCGPADADGAGISECDRASQCDAGNLCCDLIGAWSNYGKCLPSCPGVQRCESNGECVDGGHCSHTTYYPTCMSP